MTVRPVRHRWFDDWRGASGLPLRRLVEEVAALLAQHEVGTGARHRRRREADLTRYRSAVEGVVANLAHAVLMPPETGRLAVLTGHGRTGASRYDNPAYGKPFAGLLGALDSLGLLSWHLPAARRGEASSIAPTEAFAGTVRQTGVTLSDFGRLPGEETIILKRKLREGSAASCAMPGRVDYPDTAATVAMRETTRSINAFMEAADVAFVDDGRGTVDHRQRRLLRHFVQPTDDEAPRFDLGGRMFGGFWQNLERGRRDSIRIEGEPVADLDFASMFPRLASATTGREPPAGDLYAIEGLGPEHRPALKRAMNTLLFDDFRRSAWPVPEDEDDPRLPPDWTVARTKAAIVKRHPALRGCFGIGLGYGLMHRESVILVQVLEEMRARDIVSLSLHDGLLVPRSRVEESRTIMEAVAREITGQALPVAMKGRLSAAPSGAPSLHL